ncbi:hypothetical protein TNCV_2955231 [Trichonephila clavipes]|nr:hypothetical protein TNCV_2955231 [Trichonephila clavipes]
MWKKRLIAKVVNDEKEGECKTPKITLGRALRRSKQMDSEKSGLSFPQNWRYLVSDSARPHFGNGNAKPFFSSGWEPLHHPPYSPDLAPRDFICFRL